MRTYKIIASILLLALAGLSSLAGEMEIGARRSLQAASGPFEVAGDPESYAIAWLDQAKPLTTLWVAVYEDSRPAFTRLVAGGVDAEAGFFLERTPDGWAVAWRASGTWRLSVVSSGESEATPFDRGEHLVAVAADAGAGRLLLLIDTESETSLISLDPASGERNQLHTFPVKMTGAALLSHADGASIVYLEHDTDDLYYSRIGIDGGELRLLKLNSAPVKSSSRRLGAADDAVLVGWVEDGSDQSTALIGRLGRDAGLEVLPISAVGKRVSRISLSQQGDRLVVWDESDETRLVRLLAMDGSWDSICEFEYKAQALPLNTWLLGDSDRALLFEAESQYDGRQFLSARDVVCHPVAEEKSSRSTLKSDVSPAMPMALEECLQEESERSTRGAYEEPCDGLDNDSDGTIDNGCDLTCDNPMGVGPEILLSNEVTDSGFGALIWTGDKFAYIWNHDQSGDLEIYFTFLDEFGSRIGAETRITYNLGHSGPPEAVWTGSEFGITWLDDRNGQYDVYFARLDSTGDKIGSDVRLSTVTSSKNGPSIAWTGTEYGICWGDGRTWPFELYFARVNSSSGIMIGSDYSLAETVTSHQDPSLVWTGSQYGLLWTDDRDFGAEEIYFLRLYPDGTRKGDTLRVTDDPEWSLNPNLVATGTDFVAAWSDWRTERGIYTASINSLGNQIGSDTRITYYNGQAYDPFMVKHDDEIGLAWTDYRDGTSSEIYFTRLDLTGAKIGTETRISFDPDDSFEPRLAWTVNGYAAVWFDRRIDSDDYFRRIACCDDEDSDGYSECLECNDADPDANPDATEILDGLDNDCDSYSDEGFDRICEEPESWGTDNRISQDPATSGDPALSWNGSEYGVVWPDGRDGNVEIYFSVVDWLGNRVGSALRISDDDAFDSDRPSIAWNGVEYGVAWHDDRDGNSEIYFARLDETGARISSEIRITADSALSEYPAIVWTGSHWAIAWEDRRDGNREIYFTRLDASDNKIGQDVRVTEYAGESYRPSLLWTGSEFGVAWHDHRDGNYEIYFATLDEFGNKTIDDLRITNDLASSYDPSLGYSDYEFAIAYSDDREGNNEIYLAWLEYPGTFTVHERRITDDTASSTAPSLVWTGDEFGLVWQEQRDGNYEIYAARAAYSGLQIGSDVRLTYNSSSSYKPAIAWNGHEYGAVWYDGRNGGSEIYFTHMRCCDDEDGDGYNECAGDSNDQDPLINPDAVEACDGFDNDGDGSLDEGCDGSCDSAQLDATPAVISDAVATVTGEPYALVWAGSEYGAAWTEALVPHSQALFARLDSSGNMIGSAQRISEYSGPSSTPALAWTGTGYGVAWLDDRDGNDDIYFNLLDPSGSPTGADRRITDSPGSKKYLAIVWTGSGYGLVWVDDRTANGDIYFVRLDSAGNKIGQEIRLSSRSRPCNLPSIAWTGEVFGIAWVDDFPDADADVIFTILNQAGEEIVSEIYLTSPATSQFVRNCSVAWSGSNFGVAWVEDGGPTSETYLTLVNESGSIVGSDTMLSDGSGYAAMANIAWTGSEFRAVWRGSALSLFSVRVDDAGNLLSSPSQLRSGTLYMGKAVIAWSGSEFGLLWKNVEVPAEYELLFAKLSCCDDMDSDGYDECSGDTNDVDPEINPDATERCDSVDNDGNGYINEGCDGICDAPERAGNEYRVTDSGHGTGKPEIIWNGNGYTTVFYEYVTSPSNHAEIFFARFDNTGSQIGSNVRVTFEDSDCAFPSITWTGEEYGVAWIQIEASWEIFFARLDSAGNVIGSSIRVTDDGDVDGNPQVIWTGSEYGLIWKGDVAGNDQLLFARFDEMGNKIGSTIQITSDADVYAYTLRAIWTGEQYALSWLDNRGAGLDLYFARLDDKGNMIGTESIIPSGGPTSSVSLAWNGSGYGLAWSEFPGSYHDLYFIRLDVDGSPIAAAQRLTNDSDHDVYPSLVWSGGEYGLVWHGDPEPEYEIYFAPISADGTMGPEVRISTGIDDSFYPKIAWSGTEFGIVWEDNRHGAADEIYFARVRCCDDMDSDGYTECEEDGNDASVLVNPDALEVCDGVANNSDYFMDEICDGICDAPERAGAGMRVSEHSTDSSYPAIVWTGSEYGLVWYQRVFGVSEDMELYLARFNSYGNQIGDDVRITYDDWDSAYPSVVWTGSEYGIAWVENQNGLEIRFGRFDAAGSMIGSDIRLTMNDIEDRAPHLAWNGSEYGVLWKGLVSGINQLFFARLDAAGNPIGPNIQLTTDASVYGDEFALVWTGMEYGLTWSDDRTNHTVYFAQLDRFGNMIGTATALTNGVIQATDPTLTWAGGEYGVVWSDAPAGYRNLVFARLDWSGTMIGSETRLTDDSVHNRHPVLAWSGHEYALSWHSWRTGNDEIYFVTLSADGTIGSEIRITEDPGGSTYPAIVWSGAGYGLTWHDDRHGPREIFFARVACCDDIDSDGYNECQTETNDAAPTINPDYPEICDGYDNNSDQSMDEVCDRDCDSPERWGAEIRITEDAALSGAVSVAWNGNGYGLAWHDERDGNQEIYFAALDSSGAKSGADVRLTGNSGISANPSMVWTGSGYGMVWRDSSSGNYEILFKLLDASGAPIIFQRQISHTSGSSYSPCLAWNGSEFGVAWMDHSSGDWEIYFARIDAAGNKIGLDRRLTSRAGNSWAPQLVWDGNGYGLSWQEEGDGVLEIYFMKLDPHGNKIGSDLRLTNDPANSYAPRMTWTGSEYGVTWYDGEPGNNEIYFARVHEDGYQIGSNIRVTYHSSITSEPHITWSGSEYGLSWLDNRYGDFEIAFARLDPAGSKIGGNLRISEASGWSEWPRIVWNGTHYAMAWQDERDGNKEIYFASVRCCDDADSDGWTTCEGDSNDGSSLIHPGRTEVCDGVDNNGDGALDEVCVTGCDSPDMPGSEIRETNSVGTSGGAATVWTGAFYGVAWHDDRDGNQEVYFNRYYPDGTAVGSDLRITFAETNSANPSLVWTGEEYGIVFRDAREGNYEMYFIRLDPWGSKIGEEVRITYDPAASYGPTLVWTGSEYGLAWMDNRSGNWSLYMARIDSNGNKLGSDMLVSDSGSDAWNPHLAWSGSLYGLTWRDNRGTDWELYFTRIDELGNKLAPDTNVTNESHKSSAPSMVWAGGEFAISWYEEIPGNKEVYFTRMGEDGLQIGGNVRVTYNSSISANPELAWTGTEYGVTWYDHRDGNFEIYFARLDSAGAKIGSDTRISHNSNNYSEYPVIAWDGAEYGIFWQDQRDGNYEIYFSAVKCCGNDIDSDGWGACDDCNDRIDDINPGETEVCDNIDNNCDTVIDEGFFTPGVTSGLAIGADKQTFDWDGEPIADRYDIVKGDLLALRSSGGNFNTSLLDCLENDSGDASAPDGLDPGAGAGWYYLVRAVDDCKEGSYDSGQPSQVGLRDAEIDASGNSCP